MTIEEVMRLAREAAHKRATPANWHGLEAAVQALVAQARDEEAEECAKVCTDECNRAMDQYTLKEKDPTQRAIYGAMGVAATNCRDGIRARIAARKVAP